MTKKIEIDGEQYEIDLEQAESLGLIKKLSKPITDISPGDVFYSSDYGYMVIIQRARYNTDLYIFTGLHDSMEPYVHSQMTKSGAIKWLNSHGDKMWVGNIKKDINQLLRSYYPKK